MVPLAGIEPALLAELDFESSASTNFTTGASHSALAKVRPSRKSDMPMPRRNQLLVLNVDSA
jgi:hypothetical protein